MTWRSMRVARTVGGGSKEEGLGPEEKVHL